MNHSQVSVEFLEQNIALNRFEIESVFGSAFLEKVKHSSHAEGMKAIEKNEPQFFSMLSGSKFRKPHHSILYLKTIYTYEHHAYLQRISMGEIRTHREMMVNFEKLKEEGGLM